MSERNFSYICRIGECEREKLVARIAALEIERNNELEGNARFRVEHEHRVRLLYARIAELEGDADMVDEREMRSNLRIEALEADRLKSKLLLCEAAASIKALEAALQKVVIQERRVAASTDMTRSAMREGAAELANEIDAALGALKGGGDE